MSERTSYAPGTFSWAELTTSDADGAKAFYSALFGWTYEDNPVGEGSVYSMALLDGRYAAALYASEQPPHWNSYVTVASADEVAARAATVIAPPFDVMDSGRMAVVADPAGAVLCLWEPRNHPGATVVNRPGALTWNDLLTPDPEAAAAYYGELFGWTAVEMPGGAYRVIKNGERSNGGIMAHPGDAAWTPYFGCEDVDAAIARAEELGGKRINGPMQMPAGTIAVLADPQGAAFAVWAGTYDE